MPRGRGKVATLFLAILGVCTLVLCALAFKDAAMEWWWLRKLESGDEQGRLSAIKGLSEVGSERAVLPLLELASEVTETGTADGPYPIPVQAEAALEALFKLVSRKQATVVPLLIEALGSQKWTVRWRASQLLAKIGPEAKEAVPKLVEALGDESHYVFILAGNALRRIGSPAVAALRDALSDRNINVRTAASLVLHRISSDSKAAAIVLQASSNRKSRDFLD